LPAPAPSRSDRTRRGVRAPPPTLAKEGACCSAPPLRRGDACRADELPVGLPARAAELGVPKRVGPPPMPIPEGGGLREDTGGLPQRSVSLASTAGEKLPTDDGLADVTDIDAGEWAEDTVGGLVAPLGTTCQGYMGLGSGVGVQARLNFNLRLHKPNSPTVPHACMPPASRYQS